MNLVHSSIGLCLRRLLFVPTLLVCFTTAAMGANSITGVVRNQSRGEPAAGDQVILVWLEGEMQEARAKTDGHGAFTLPAQYADKRYLVRVIRQSASYDQPASAGDAVGRAVVSVLLAVRIWDFRPALLRDPSTSSGQAHSKKSHGWPLKSGGYEM